MLRFLVKLSLAVILLLGSGLNASLPAVASPHETMFIAAIPGLGSFLAGQRPSYLGVKEGKLSPCPASPNCVVSQGATDAEHAIAPLQYTTDPTTAMAKLKSVIESMPRTQIIEQTDNYLYAEFTSQLMGFVDDVEFYFDPTESIVHVRSASRLGESDLGVNRKRIEDIRKAFVA